MRHKITGRKLSRRKDHREAMLANLASSLIKNGSVRTTDAKAKEVRPFVERMVTFARRGDLHARRIAAATIRDKKILVKLFNGVASELKDRNGGYTRITKSGFRKGDGASMAIVELLIEKKVDEKGAKKDKSAKKKTEKTEK